MGELPNVLNEIIFATIKIRMATTAKLKTVSELAPDQWVVGEVKKTRGASMASVSEHDKTVITFRLDVPVRAPFGLSQFNEKNLDLSIENDELLASLQKLDAWACKHAGNLGVAADGYSPLMKQKDGLHAPLLRTKINTQYVRVWGKDGEPDVEFDYAALHGASLQLVIRLRGFWVHSGRWGLLLQAQDLLVLDRTATASVSPFVSTVE